MNNKQGLRFHDSPRVRQLPATIAKSIKSKYPKGTIDDVDQINTGGKITYSSEKL
jgi:hypothetical protein